MMDSKQAPAAAAAAGMTKLAFCDDFETDATIDFSGEGKPGYIWYVDRPYNGRTFTREELRVSDSMLHFVPEECHSAVGLPTYSKKGRTGFLMAQGYAEAKMRFATRNVVPASKRQGWPAFWGMGVGDVLGKREEEIGELDVLEAVLVKPEDGNSGVIYSGTLHHHRRLYETVDGKETIRRLYASNLINSTGYQDNFDYLDDGWHTYAALWEEGHIAWFLDGHEMHSARFAPGVDPDYFYRDDPTPLPRIETLRPEIQRNWVGAHTVMNHEQLVLFLGADKHWPIDVDWVRVWEKP